MRIKQLKAVPINITKFHNYHHLFRHQITNNVPYTAESIEDNICLQKRMELLKRMWLQERTGPRLENILLNLFAFIIRVDYVKL